VWSILIDTDASRISLAFLGGVPSWVSRTADLNDLFLLDFCGALKFHINCAIESVLVASFDCDSELCSCGESLAIIVLLSSN
jgi:hypothetical protein